MSTRTTLGVLDAPTRMFLVSLCLRDADLVALGVFPTDPGCCVSPATRARGVLQHMLTEDPELAHRVATLLDLRHADTVAAALQSLADRRGSLRPVGIDIPDNHRVTATDVVTVDRALIRFEPTGKRVGRPVSY